MTGGRILGVAIALTYLAAHIWLAAFMVQRRRQRARRERVIAQHLARLRRDEPPGPPPALCCTQWIASAGMVHGPDCVSLPGLETAYEELIDACCERWWTSLETDHDPACRNQTRSNAA